ncbi:MAG: Na+/H+ antiporter NhaC family protein [Opitutales bacterium]
MAVAPVSRRSLLVLAASLALAWLGAFFPAWVNSLGGSLVPTAIALLAVVLTRRVVTGLLAGSFAGALMLVGGRPDLAIGQMVTEHLLPNFGSSWKVGALLFTLILGGFAALIEKGGGLVAAIHRLTRGGSASRRLQATTLGLGLVCFFDGLANSMLLGRVTREPARRCGVSGVKMAYLVDSTSSSVACLAFISTWIAFQLSLIQEGLVAQGSAVSPYTVFFQAIPFNYYCWFTLLLLAAVIRTGFHPGPMRAFEAQARRALPESSPPQPTRTPGEDSGLWRALLPLAVLVLGIMALFYLWEARPLWPLTFRKFALAFGSGEGAHILLAGSVLGTFVAWLAFPPVSRSPERPLPVFLEGVRALMVPALVLVSAWILSSVVGGLDTGTRLSEALTGRLPPAWLAAGVFLAGAVISFTTGTSWGTMGILMPLALPTVFSLGEGAAIGEAETYRLLASVVAAVFSGAVFGDHCSPFSDTTIVSSIACGVEPHDHVRTQLPFALIAAGVALPVGFLPSGYGLHPVVSLGIGALLLWGIALWGSGRLKRPS